MVKILLRTDFQDIPEQYALVDDDDYEFLMSFRWYLHKEGYALGRRTFMGKSETKLMHRLLIPLKKKQVVHHRNHNKLDNRKENLLATDNRTHIRYHKLKHRGVNTFDEFYPPSHLLGRPKRV